MGKVKMDSGFLPIVLFSIACGGVTESGSSDGDTASGGRSATSAARVTGGQLATLGSSSQTGGTGEVIRFIPVVEPCGNGQLDSNEGCDDGNHQDDDGCSALCQIESAACPVGQEHCVNVAHCGDRILTNYEGCDDGNSFSGDGCRGDCAIVETGWVCLEPGRSCRAICGDGSRVGGESCDDGNVLAGDGCSAHCSVELTSFCANGQTIDCTPLGVCGDAVLDDSEECDDGAANRDGAYGGCTTSCHLGPYCGDAILNGSEQCDLGLGVNTAGVLYGDLGCSAGCRRNPFCGDYIMDLDFGESCDTGGTRHSGSYCSDYCQIILP